MSFAEEPTRWRGWTIEIVGTDLSRSAVERARAGVYSQFEVQRGLPVVQMVRWFEEIGEQQWRIAPALRQAVRFQTGNITEPPPRPGRFDVILCRNMAMYLRSGATGRLWQELQSQLRVGGVLVVGKAERPIGASELQPIGPCTFRRVG